MSPAERRKDQRLTFQSSAFIEKEYFGGADDALITNVSASGISIQTVLTLQQGEFVSIQLENPATHEKIRLMGEVSWIDLTDENNSQAGIVFHPMDNALTVKLTTLLSSLKNHLAPQVIDTSPKTSKQSVHAEIERILQIPSTSIHTSSPENEEKTSVEAGIEKSAFGPVHMSMHNQKKPISLFTIIVLILLVIAGAVSYYLYDQFLIQDAIFSSPINTSATKETPLKPQDTDEIVEQNLDETGIATQDATPPKADSSEPVPTPMDASKEKSSTSTPGPHQGILTFPTHTWLKTFTWTGDPLNLAINLTFTQNIDTQSIKVQKLNFDANNIRYLLRMPSPEETLSQKEIVIDHPLVKRARLGLHNRGGKEMHIVFDVTSPSVSISTRQISPKQTEITFQ
ncbi:MAG: PilZ domain-containing protein [Deltaproteobacteria bacterium]|nr:PilZ domain-containing protein [Deltaproteobacteria bacterium]